MSKIGDIVCIDNDIYTASIATDACLCTGCDAEYDAVLCDKITTTKFCNRNIIWIKQQPVETQTTTCNQTKGEPEMNTAKTTEEPKYTLAEFLEAYDAYMDDSDAFADVRDEFLSKYLLRFSSPEYKNYLRLKVIFG